MAKKATLDSLAGNVERLSKDVQGAFKRLGKVIIALTGNEDGTVEGLVHQVKDLKDKFKAHEDEHDENEGKVSDDLAGFNIEIGKKFKLVWIGLGIVCVIAFVGFWLAVGLPGEALKSAAELIFGALGG